MFRRRNWMRFGMIQNCALFFSYYRTNFERFRKWKKRTFTRLNKDTGSKRKRPKFYQIAWKQVRKGQRENDYLIAKWFNTTPDSVRFWTIFDYYSALEEILKESDRQRAQMQKQK